MLTRTTVDRSGKYKPKSIRIVFVGPGEVDTVWALNVLGVSIPIHAKWEVGAERDKTPDQVIDEWLTRGTTDEIFVWPSNCGLAWNAILECSNGISDRVNLGEARFRRRQEAISFDAPYERNDLSISLEGAEIAPNESTDHGPPADLVICVPTLGKTSLEWAVHLMRLRQPIGVNCSLDIVVGRPVDEARCELVKRALDVNPAPKYLMFLGDDMYPPPHALQELYSVMQKAQIRGIPLSAISGLYSTKSDPSIPLMWRKKAEHVLVSGRDYNLGEVVEVDGTGLDFCLINSSEIGKVPEPRFKTVQDKMGTMTEDTYFWMKFLESTGSRPFVDTNVVIGHYDQRTGKIY